MQKLEGKWDVEFLGENCLEVLQRSWDSVIRMEHLFYLLKVSSSPFSGWIRINQDRPRKATWKKSHIGCGESTRPKPFLIWVCYSSTQIGELITRCTMNILALPFPPKKFGAYMCMEPPFPLTQPDFLPVSSAKTPSTDTPITYEKPWALQRKTVLIGHRL